jgi:hypothetical protein
MDSDDENFNDYKESKNMTGKNMDDLDLRRINEFIDDKYRNNNVPPRFHQKPFTAEGAAEIE